MKFQDLDFKHKRVFLRADLNIPLQEEQILYDHKLKAILPTINYIQKKGSKVILATHLGRPKAQDLTNFYDPKLSTQVIVKWFEEQEYPIKLERDLEQAQKLSHINFNEILMLENLRFFNGEHGNQEEGANLVEYLKPLADIYVNDAFGLIHRNDTSITLLPQSFDCKDRAFGLLIDKEVNALNNLKDNVQKPYVLVIGGNKIKTKIKLLKHFLNIPEASRPNTILIGGAISNTFLYAQGYNVGKSLIEKDFVDFIKDFLDNAKDKEIKVLLPKDILCVKEIDEEKLEHHEVNKIPDDQMCIDIGKSTINEFEKEIVKAKTIFINGSMGIYQNKNYSVGTRKILQAIADNKNYTVAGGGDCVAAINMFSLYDDFDFISTGGGATLAYLSTQEPFKTFESLKCLEC